VTAAPTRTFYQVVVYPRRGCPFDEGLPYVTRAAAEARAARTFDPSRHREVEVQEIPATSGLAHP